ncbi:MAG: hypothetical protein JNM17_32130 [Archangium sp.]|nr:hypothetical protein [Archangium sp.]
MRDQWILVGATIVLALALLVFGRGEGDGAFVEVSIVPRDAGNLGCEGVFGAYSCQATSGALCPFVTTSNRLVALPGLFEQPAVASWLSHPKTPDERVRVRCRARPLQMGVAISIRFSADAQYQPTTADIAEISACEVR